LTNRNKTQIPPGTRPKLQLPKKINHHEVTGVLIVLLLSLHTTRYKDIFFRESILKKHTGVRGIGNHLFMNDWITLVESVLCWEEWLKEDRMTR
jgi:hypothetical protein